MKLSTGISLGIMMFLQYFIWSAWYVTMGTYMGQAPLHATDVQIGATYGALAIATMISPFFVGLIADRFFAAQKIMGILHVLGAGILFMATKIESSTTFYWIVLLYSLLYMPTIALSNSVAFSQMTDPGKQFPWIRVFGTIGWIVAGLCIGQMGIEKSANTFYIAAAVSLGLGLFSFVLPNTPPKGKTADASSAIGTEAFVLLKEKSFLVFFIAAILICIPLSFYYGFANPFLNEIGFPNAASKMTLGQVSEAVFILAIPFLFNRAGVKNMLIFGMTAWILRYVFFAYGNVENTPWMLYAGIILHGICYDFFFVTGYMYTEKKAGAKIKNAAQGLFTFATYGLGMVIGTSFSGYIVNAQKTSETTHNWQGIWMTPAYIAAAVLIFFILFFKEKKEPTPIT